MKRRDFGFGNEPRHYVKRVLKSKIFMFSAILVVLIIISLIFDKQLALLAGSMHSPFLDAIMKHLFRFEESSLFYVFIFVIGGLFIFLKRQEKTEKRNNFLKFVLAFFVTAIVGLALKAIIARPRPNMSSADSFPSGHAGTTFTPLWFIKNNALWIIWLVFSILVVFSRFYMQVHYASDIFAGILLSYLISTAFIKLIKK